MMVMVIVPEHLEAAINAEIDRYLTRKPELSHLREQMYTHLLSAYSEYGVIAELINNQNNIGDDNA